MAKRLRIFLFRTMNRRIAYQTSPMQNVFILLHIFDGAFIIRAAVHARV